jgi:hypothetical protein
MEIHHFNRSINKISALTLLALVCLAALLAAGIPQAQTIQAAGATTTLHIVKYKDDNRTVQAEKTVDYRWVESNLPVHGDGTTHYYHQGPVFEGDPWDPAETVNLKDKGAVKGTAVKDLCELVGGMETAGEVIVHAVDGWTVTLGYANIYAPPESQGDFVICWYKGPDTRNTDTQDHGYPADDEYNEALQIVVMASTTNAPGQYVFGNSDMKASMPQERYQHYYEGLPSTNGLSGKWINELRIYPRQAPTATPEEPQSYQEATTLPWPVIGLGAAGILSIISGILVWVRKLI